MKLERTPHGSKALRLPESAKFAFTRAHSGCTSARGGIMKFRFLLSGSGLYLVIALLITASAATPEAAGSADDSKIDRTLMARLTDEADAVAPFFVVFGERADLKPAYRIAHRTAPGRLVADALQAVA